MPVPAAPAPASPPALESGPQTMAALSAVPALAAGARPMDLPTGGTETYGADRATGATASYAAPGSLDPTAPYATPASLDPTAPYAAPASLDPTAYHSSGPPAEATAPYRDFGLLDIPAPALASPALAGVATEPVTASAPVALTADPAPSDPDPLAAYRPPSLTHTPGDYAGSWPMPAGGHSTQAERVIVFARAQIGRPCVWGAVGPGSYDASGLTQAAWKAVGVMLPRSTQAQWGAGAQVSLADVQVGDLVFFHDDLSHVGIWSGDGMMIHAPGPGALIREESVFFAGQSAIKGAIRPV
ncbi:C40 family peptidase [Streptomyces sp. NPDC101110]|uniref:C40 family peptidase n=1 Tax=Streptomyces sp. NPDC101110 TaxID=3366104 RepID=UPI003813D3BD